MRKYEIFDNSDINAIIEGSIRTRINLHRASFAEVIKNLLIYASSARHFSGFKLKGQFLKHRGFLEESFKPRVAYFLVEREGGMLKIFVNFRLFF